MMIVNSVSLRLVGLATICLLLTPISCSSTQLEPPIWDGREAVFWQWMYQRFNLSKPKDPESDAWRNLTGTDYDKYELLTVVYRIVEEDIKVAELVSEKEGYPPANLRPELSRVVLHEPAVGRGPMRIIDATVRCKKKLRIDELHFKLIVSFSAAKEICVIHSSVAVKEFGAR
jgi:hypothetical protein